MTHVLAVLAGFGLGLFYFGMLWLTVRRLGRARRPGWLLLASWVGRLTVLGAGFILLAKSGAWTHLVVALGGLLLARTVLVRRLRPEPARPVLHDIP